MQPDTSIEAFKSVTPEMLAGHWGNIIEALKVLKLAIYTEIAEHCKFEDKNMVSRRLKELEGAEIVYKPGTKKPTKSGRLAYQYAIRNADTVVPVIESQPQTTAVDHANMILEIAANTKKQNEKRVFATQYELFD